MHTVVEALGYTLCVDGSVLNKEGKPLKGSRTPEGYYQLRVRLTCGKTKTYYIHRLIASKYVSNPDEIRYNRVNHKDGNKANNAADNLEWVDARGNMLHAMGVSNYLEVSKEDIIEARKSRASAYYKARWAAGYRW